MSLESLKAKAFDLLIEVEKRKNEIGLLQKEIQQTYKEIEKYADNDKLETDRD